MAGHSKWAKIKHKKAATDARKGKVFSKLVSFIASESKKAGGERSAPGLRLAIEKARKENMPRETIERAIQKGTSDASVASDAFQGEAFGPGGVAIVIDMLTDSRNRSVAEIRHLLGSHGASLAGPGGASWAFEKTDGVWTPKTTIALSPDDEERLRTLVEALLERDDVQGVYTNAATYKDLS